MTDMLFGALVLSSIALVLVLILRTPVRRLLGPGPAFTLWLLVPAMGAATWLDLPVPAPLHQLTVSPVLASLGTFVVHPGNSLTAISDPAYSLVQSGHMLRGLWLLGTCLLVLRLLISHLRLLRQAKMPNTHMQTVLKQHLDPTSLARIRIHTVGPAALFFWPCMILIPTDFAQRFNSRQRKLVLAHEQMHLRRADPLWCLLAELARALLWFHPLVWLALPRFRLDQELACDAATLSENPGARSDYARTLVGDLGTPHVPALASWINPRQLKERLTMIKSRHIDSPRRRFGYSLILAAIATSTLLVGAALSSPRLAMAQTAQHAPPVISVNIGSHGTYWNGDKIDALSLQHRSVVAARINPQVPVLLTVAQEVSDTKAAGTANTLHQSGLTDIETKRINTAPLANSSKSEDSLMQYRTQRRPAYPVSALRNKHEGTVVVHVHFAADGTALGALVQPTTASTDLIKSSLAATLTWRTGAGDSSWKRIPLKYELHRLKDLPDMPPLQDGQKWQVSADGKHVEAVSNDADTN